MTDTKPVNLIQKDPMTQPRCLLKHLVKQPTKYLSLRKRQTSSSSRQKALSSALPGPWHWGEGTIYSSHLFLEGLLSKCCLHPIPASLARPVKPNQTSRHPGCWTQVFSHALRRRGHHLGHKKKIFLKSEWQQMTTPAEQSPPSVFKPTILLLWFGLCSVVVLEVPLWNSAWKNNFGWKWPSCPLVPSDTSEHSIFKLFIILWSELRRTKKEEETWSLTTDLYKLLCYFKQVHLDSLEEKNAIISGKNKSFL